MLELTLNWGYYIISIAKTASKKKIRALIPSISSFLVRLLCISINLPYTHAWNTVFMSELVLLVAAWKCCISYKNGYAGMLVLHLLLLLNPWLIDKMQPAEVFSIGIILVFYQVFPSLLKSQSNKLSFFPNMIYWPVYILDKKRNWCNIQTGQK